MYKNNFICAIKHNGRILRESDEEVCLPFGSQYSILLKNKDSRRALVDIEVDGENVLSGNSLIVNGNTSQEIKGFMRDMSVTNRFKFIHKTKEISDYRGDRLEDGLITVSYRFEKEKKEPIRIVNKPKPYPRSWPYPDAWPDRYPDIKFKSNMTTYYSSDGISIPVPDQIPIPISSLSTPLIGGCIADYRKGGVVSDDGITVKGSKVTQNYQYGDIGELEYNSYVITLRLKGRLKKNKKIVRKPLTVKTKLLCPTCGRRSKSSSKFCSNCGTYLR